jgi:hypothetical protein
MKRLDARRFHALRRAEQRAMLRALKALLGRVKATGLGDQPVEPITFGETLAATVSQRYLAMRWPAPACQSRDPRMLLAAIAYPYLANNYPLLCARVRLDSVAQFWAPRELPRRRREAALLPMYLELVKSEAARR